MKRLVIICIGLVMGLFFISFFAWAQHQHQMAPAGGAMKMESIDVLVEGVRVGFIVMDNASYKKSLKDMNMEEDIPPDTTHNITVTLKDDKTQKEIADAQVNMKVIDPKGKDQIKPLKFEKLMNSYDAYFNLTEKGKYQIMILFKVGDQKKMAGIYYDLN